MHAQLTAEAAAAAAADAAQCKCRWEEAMCSGVVFCSRRALLACYACSCSSSSSCCCSPVRVQTRRKLQTNESVVQGYVQQGSCCHARPALAAGSLHCACKCRNSATHKCSIRCADVETVNKCLRLCQQVVQVSGICWDSVLNPHG